MCEENQQRDEEHSPLSKRRSETIKGVYILSFAIAFKGQFFSFQFYCFGPYFSPGSGIPPLCRRGPRKGSIIYEYTIDKGRVWVIPQLAHQPR
jgi:hypothetical protein